MAAKKGNKYAVGNPNSGRPTKLTEELLAKAEAYLDWCDKNPVKVSSKYTKDGGHIADDYCPRLPSAAGLARHLGIHKDTLYAWAKENKVFSDCIKDLGAEQEKQAVELGHAGRSNPIFAKFILSAQHEYREKTEVEQSGNITINIIPVSDGDPITKG